MKLIILNILLFFCCINASSQEWVPIDHSASGVTVHMPKLPKYSTEQVFTPQGITKKIVYSTEYMNIVLIFEVQELIHKSKKDIKNTIKRSIDQTMLQHQGSNPKISKKKKRGVEYVDVEYPLISGALMRSQFFEYNGYLFHLLVKGLISDVYSETSNQFINSWKWQEVEILSELENIPETHHESLDNKEWVTYPIGLSASLQFPGIPFSKTTIIENSQSDINLQAFTYMDLKTGLNYVSTIRPYSNDQGQLTDAAIYEYYLERIKRIKRYKLVEKASYNADIKQGVEYVFSKGTQFYRLKLVRVNNIMYQFLVKGKRKSIYSEDSKQFFNSIKISD